MIVDDRLETVLRTVAAGPGAVATQMRQLLDLLGRAPARRWSEQHSAALARLDSLSSMLRNGSSSDASACAATWVLLLCPAGAPNASSSPKVSSSSNGALSTSATALADTADDESTTHL